MPPTFKPGDRVVRHLHRSKVRRKMTFHERKTQSVGVVLRINTLRRQGRTEHYARVLWSGGGEVWEQFGNLALDDRQ
jgi:hypothetical protein